MALPIRAMEFEAPAPPQAAAEYLPKEADSFGEGLWNVLSAAAKAVAPELSQAGQSCLRVFLALLIPGLVTQFSAGISRGALEASGTAAVAALLLEPASGLIRLGAQTAQQVHEYGKLLLPVLASALAAGGGVSTSAALYVGTAVFDTILSSAVTGVLLPMIWMFLALSIAHTALGEEMLLRLQLLIKKLMEWALKLTLYLFTGYMAITGAVSGTADAAAAKAARLAISGSVPVVGGILSDAADTVLLSAAALGSGAGVWGILTILAIFCAPIAGIGVQYVMLRLTAAAGAAVCPLRCTALVEDFAGAMGLLMALVSTQTVLYLVSTVCFLRGAGG